MYDKADLRIPQGVKFTPGFMDRIAWWDSRRTSPPWRSPSMAGRWKPDPAYAGRASLEETGLDLVVHMECRMTKQRTHKFEVLRAGEKTYDEMIALVREVVDCDPQDMGLMRVDATADVDCVPVDWFKRHVRVRYKQVRRELGATEAYQLVSKGRSETLYDGQKPNQFRIYDKTGERRMQWMKECRRIGYLNRSLAPENRLKPVSFETKYGYSPTKIITRVERALHGRDLEFFGFQTVADLLRGDLIDPFDRLMFFAPRDPERDEERDFWNLTWRDQMVAEAIMTRVKTDGVSATLRHMQAGLGKNFYRTKKQFESFLRVTENVVGIDAAGLRNAYQASTRRQLLRAA